MVISCEIQPIDVNYSCVLVVQIGHLATKKTQFVKIHLDWLSP